VKEDAKVTPEQQQQFANYEWNVELIPKPQETEKEKPKESSDTTPSNKIQEDKSKDKDTKSEEDKEKEQEENEKEDKMGISFESESSFLRPRQSSRSSITSGIAIDESDEDPQTPVMELTQIKPANSGGTKDGTTSSS